VRAGDIYDASAGDSRSADGPCGATGAPGHGCPNSIAVIGAQFVGVGSARVGDDSIRLTDTQVDNAPCPYFQGVGQTDIAFGDGKLCAGFGIVRLGVVFGVGEISSYPESSLRHRFTSRARRNPETCARTRCNIATRILPTARARHST